MNSLIRNVCHKRRIICFTTGKNNNNNNNRLITSAAINTSSSRYHQQFNGVGYYIVANNNTNNNCSININTTTSRYVSLSSSTINTNEEVESSSSSSSSDSFSISNLITNPTSLTRQSTTTTTTTTTTSNVKPWLDTTLSINERVNELLHTNRLLHPADFHDIEMKILIQSCCKQGIEGLNIAHDILDRLIVEKRRIYNNSIYNQDDKPIIVCIPEKIIETIMYGWIVHTASESSSSSPIRTAQQSMRQLLQIAIDEAKYDTKLLIEHKQQQNYKQESLLTVNIFNTYLYGLTKCATPNNTQAAITAEALLMEMTEYNRTIQNWYTKPNTKSFNLVLLAYRNTKHIQAQQRVLNLLQTMKNVHEQEKINYFNEYNVEYDIYKIDNNNKQIVTPDATTYTLCISTIIECSIQQQKRNNNNNQQQQYQRQRRNNSKQQQYQNKQNNDPFQLVINLFNEAIQTQTVIVDEAMFITVIKAMSIIIDKEHNTKQRYNIAKFSETILLMMIDNIKQKYKQTTTTTTTTTTTNNASSSTDSNDSAADYDSSSSNNNNKIKNDNNNNDEVDEKKLNCAKDDLLSIEAGYNACLDVWSRSYCKEAAPYCENNILKHGMILNNYMDIQPNTTSFNTCMYAWSKSHKFHDDCAKRAEDLLLLQHEMAKSGIHDVAPDFQSYNICIMTYANSINNKKGNNNNDNSQKALYHASRLLDQLLANIKNGHVRLFGNPTAPFTAVLSTIAKTPPVGNVTTDVSNNQTIERSLNDNQSEQSSSSSSSVDNIDSNNIMMTEEYYCHDDPYSMATRIYEEIRQDTHKIGTYPDHHAIAAYLRCIAQHCDPKSSERITIAKLLCEEAKETGELSKIVIDGLKHALGESFETVIPELKSDTTKSKNWSRNVKKSFR